MERYSVNTPSDISGVYDSILYVCNSPAFIWSAVGPHMIRTNESAARFFLRYPTIPETGEVDIDRSIPGWHTIPNKKNNSVWLDFCDLEADAKITFTSPMSSANLKGCHEVQNLGAVETYIKRYLYQNCFEIVESDVLDETMNPAEKPNGSEKPNSLEVENLIKQVQDRMSRFNDTQLDYANKAIKQRNITMLKNCLK